MVELQDIFKKHGIDYILKHPLRPNQYKAMWCISNCRTSVLGSHTDICDSCDFTQVSYNSCRNRHCPKCQTLTKERWLEARSYELLNVGYFHIVFTLPQELHPIAYQNQETVYNLFFKAVSEALMDLAADKKHLGAKIGITTILHTWGQNLHYHPHIHCVVPGGGLNAADKWVTSKKDFFIPVKVLSRMFKGKFISLLRDAKLSFSGSIADYCIPQNFDNFLWALAGKEWVVYCKPPFGSPAKVLNYLGRYTHRVAISNNRIIMLEDGKVSFMWRDYRDNNKQKIMTITAEEFIRRFMMHVLPPRFTKIRHYGLLSPRTKAAKLKLCKSLTNTPFIEKPTEMLPTLELLKKLIGKDFTICPNCKVGHLSRASPEDITA